METSIVLSDYYFGENNYYTKLHTHTKKILQLKSFQSEMKGRLCSLQRINQLTGQTMDMKNIV